MKVVSIKKQEEEAAFAKKATEQFKDHPEYYTYANGDPKPGELFAVRWNPYTVLVLRLDEEHCPSLFSVYEFITEDLPKLKTRT